jgi:transposase
MPRKKHIISLSLEDRNYLEQFSRTGTSAAYAITHARILLKADVNQPDGGWTDSEISEALDVSVATIERVRQRCFDKGVEACLKQRPRAARPSLLDGEQEAHLVALVCSSAPEGRTRWTLRMLRDQLVALEIVDSISHETVRQTLKKTNLSLGSKSAG